MFWSIIICILAVFLYRLTYSSPRPPTSVSGGVPETVESRFKMAVAPSLLKYLTVPATSKHTATVFFVHGLGDTGHGWQPVADMFKADAGLAHVKWILPHSPIRPVTANMDIEMPSWFDIYSFGFDTTEDEDGMKKSATKINDLIKYEIETNGIPASRIVLGGFSQGGTMSLLTCLGGENKLAGLAILSGWLPLRTKFKEMVPGVEVSTPIFWGHGSTDPLVKRQFVDESVEYLVKQMGMHLTRPKVYEPGGISYNLYEGMGHSTVPRELDELKSFIKWALPVDPK